MTARFLSIGAAPKARSPENSRYRKSQSVWTLWENLVASEVRKMFLSAGQRPPLWYWRTTEGHEVDLLVECAPENFVTVECKTAAQVSLSDHGHLKILREEYGPASVRKAYVACRAERAYPLSKDGLCEAVPLAGEDGLLGRIGKMLPQKT